MSGVALKRPIERIAYRRDEAAAALGVSPSKFDELVKDGRMPQPKRVDGCVLWGVHALMAAWDALPDAMEVDTGNPWD